MSATVPRGAAEEGPRAVAAIVEVVLVYEDLVSAARVKNSLERVSARFGAPGRWNMRVWRFDWLLEPLLQEQAAIEAAAADVIVLSAHGRMELPEQVRGWLSRWQDRKESRRYALVALLDSEAAERENAIVACLQRVAAVTGADLFCSFSA